MFPFFSGPLKNTIVPNELQ